MEQNKKIKRWRKIEQKINAATDGLGMPIDDGIKEAVIAFNANGFITQQSCEGHIDRAQAAPWIHIISKKDTSNLSIKADKLFKKAHRLQASGKDNEADPLYAKAHKLMDAARAPVIKVALKLSKHLEEFYTRRNVPYDTRLGMQQFGDLVRIESIGSFLQEVRPSHIKNSKLKEYQKEMSDFGKFLIERYFLSKKTS